jgi:hypothetical protein
MIAEIRGGAFVEARGGSESDSVVPATRAAVMAPSARERLEARLDELREGQAYRAYLPARFRPAAE